MGNLNIVYVDDDDDIREIAEMSLQLEETFDVRGCSSGMEALKACAENPPDVVLLDLMMPEMDGVETLKRILSEVNDKLPVIFVTARTNGEEVQRLISLGAIGVIAKPFDPMSLADKVKETMAQAAAGR